MTRVADPARTGRSGRGPVIAGLMLTMGLAAMDATIVATAVPSIVRELGGFALFPWVFSVYLLAQAISIPIYGRLADLYGRKPVLLVGTSIFLAGSLLSGASWSMVTLIVFRAVQGLGAGAIQPVTQTVVGDLYTVEERGRIQGWLSSVWGIAAVVGPAVGGAIAQYASWRWIFWLNLPVGVAALAMVTTRFHEQVVRRRHRLDVAGALLLALGAGLAVLGLLEGGTRWPWMSAPSFLVLSLAVAALAVFVWWERRAAEPMLPPWVFRRRVLIGVNLGYGVTGILTIGLTTFLPTFAQGVLGAGAVAAGFALAAMSIGWPLASTLSARLYLRIGFRDTALVGLALTLVSGVLFATLGERSSVPFAGMCSFVQGLGLGLISTPLVVGVQSVVGWERRGVVTGSAMFMRMVGSALGAAVLGGVANSTLARWLHDAPATLRGRLPVSVNAASDALTGGAQHLTPAAVAYARHGLFLATHRVFLGLVAVSLLGLLAVAIAPRAFTPLRLPDERGGEDE